jgi:hypothetical protein
LDKTHVQHVLTGIAVNIERLAAHAPPRAHRPRPLTAFQQYLDARGLTWECCWRQQTVPHTRHAAAPRRGPLAQKPQTLGGAQRFRRMRGTGSRPSGAGEGGPRAPRPSHGKAQLRGTCLAHLCGGQSVKRASRRPCGHHVPGPAAPSRCGVAVASATARWNCRVHVSCRARRGQPPPWR